MHRTEMKMNYKNTLENIDVQIEKLLLDILENRVYKSPKTEERLTALCLSREYIIDKIKVIKNKELNIPNMCLYTEAFIVKYLV